MPTEPMTSIVYLAIAILAILILPSIRVIGPTQIGLVLKRFSFKSLSEDNPIAFKGEAGYQADLLMPGWRFKFWIVYKVEKHPWIQVPAGQIAVVISQIGSALPVGAKSATYKPVFGDFTQPRTFVEQGGQKGVQRPVLPPGTLAPIHPVGFLVITMTRAYGIPISTELKRYAHEHRDRLDPAAFGLSPGQLAVTRIEPLLTGPDAKGRMVDVVGVVTVFEGDPLPAGDIASRIGGFKDIEDWEKAGQSGAKLIERILGVKNDVHNNYQDFQRFLDGGGRIGLQHDPLLYGAYNLNPFLVGVEIVPMLVVQQGEVAVVKSYVGLPSEDVSGLEFKFGTLVKPGHRGIWEEPLRTGKYAINPRCYQAEIVPTFILTLSWADAVSRAHQLDAELKPIDAKSREGFVFRIDLQVQIHVPDTKAPRVISIVGTMQNLVTEVLQAAVGNHFRDKLQSLPAVRFIETRQEVQREAYEHIKSQLMQYEVETKGVYIQDVVLPAQLVEVLTQREIANQKIETLKKQQQAENERISMEKTKGQADMQTQLASSEVQISIKENNAKARKAEADGEAEYIQRTGTAKGAEVRAVGLAKAEGYRAQVAALGSVPTAVVNAITALSERNLKFVPEILVAGGNGAGAVEGLAAALMRHFAPAKVSADKAPAAGEPVAQPPVPPKCPI